MRRFHLLFLIPVLVLFLSIFFASCGTDSGNGDGGGPVILPPANFTIAADSDSSVTFSWTLTSEGESQIIVERRNAGSVSAFSVAEALQPGTEEYTDSPINPNLGYEYRWRVTGGGEEAVSDTVTIRNDRTLSSGEELGEIDYSDEINSVAFSPITEAGSVLIAYGSTDATAEVREIAGGTISAVRQRFLDHTGRVTSVAFHPGGELLGTASFDATAKLWDLSNGNVLHTLSGHISTVNEIGFDGSGLLAVTAGEDGNVYVWNTEDGSQTNNFSNGSEYATADLSPDGELVAGGGHNKLTVDLWERETGALTQPLLEEHNARVLSVDFSSDGETLASAGEDNNILLWDMSDNSLVGEILSAHPDDVNSVAFGPSGRYLVSGGGQSVKIWDTQDLSSEVFTFTDHIATVRSVAFSPDGTLIASGSVDNRVLVYRLTYSFFGWEIVD